MLVLLLVLVLVVLVLVLVVVTRRHRSTSIRWTWRRFPDARRRSKPKSTRWPSRGAWPLVWRSPGDFFSRVKKNVVYHSMVWYVEMGEKETEEEEWVVGWERGEREHRVVGDEAVGCSWTCVCVLG